MAFTCHRITKSSSPFTIPLGIVPSVLTTIGTTVTAIDFLFSRKVSEIISLFAFFYFHSIVCRDYSAVLCFLFFGVFFSITRSGFQAEVIRFISESLRNMCVSFSRNDSGFCTFNLFKFIIIFIIIYSFRVFRISVSWWSFTRDWVIASLLKSPGLFSVFWPFSIMLSFGWSPLVRQLPSPPGPLIIL